MTIFKKIEYRSLQRNGLCSVCGKGLVKGGEKSIIFKSMNGHMDDVHICDDCLNKIIEFRNTETGIKTNQTERVKNLDKWNEKGFYICNYQERLDDRVIEKRGVFQLTAIQLFQDGQVVLHFKHKNREYVTGLYNDNYYNYDTVCVETAREIHDYRLCDSTIEITGKYTYTKRVNRNIEKEFSTLDFYKESENPWEKLKSLD